MNVHSVNISSGWRALHKRICRNLTVVAGSGLDFLGRSTKFFTLSFTEVCGSNFIVPNSDRDLSWHPAHHATRWASYSSLLRSESFFPRGFKVHHLNQWVVAKRCSIQIVVGISWRWDYVGVSVCQPLRARVFSPFYISADFTLACGWDHLLCRVLPARREVKGVFSGKTAVAKADK